MSRLLCKYTLLLIDLSPNLFLRKGSPAFRILSALFLKVCFVCWFCICRRPLRRVIKRDFVFLRTLSVSSRALRLCVKGRVMVLRRRNARGFTDLADLPYAQRP